RILGGGSYEPNVALLNVRKKCVLLGFVEAMDFINEDDGAGPILPCPLRVRHDSFNFLDTGKHGRELDELRLGEAGDDLGQRCLAGTGRAPKDERAEIVALNLRTQRFAGSDQMFLTDILVECARTHTVRQRTGAVTRVVRARSGLKQSHEVLVQ